MTVESNEGGPSGPSSSLSLGIRMQKREEVLNIDQRRSVQISIPPLFLLLCFSSSLMYHHWVITDSFSFGLKCLPSTILRHHLAGPAVSLRL